MFSVVIPVFNQQEFVRVAIESAAGQSFRDFEIIVVDDGSTDGSRAIIDEFGSAIRYIWQENQGLAGARNTGIKAAQGEFIALLDADDQWCPTYLEQMRSLISENPDAVAFYCMAQCMDAAGRDLPQFVGGPPVESTKLYWKLLGGDFLIPSTVTFRRMPIVEAGYFDASLPSCEDWDLWLRLLPAGRIVGATQSLVRYRVHQSSLSANLDGMHAAARRVVEKHFGAEDGNPTSWIAEKRRAYGGMYRYQCITFVQRQNNWEACVPLMRRALQIDPSLALDLAFYYELALGDQPAGHRGVSCLQDFSTNATHLQHLMLQTIQALAHPAIRRHAIGTSYHALALVAYNWGPRPLFRRYFRKALIYRPDLMGDVSLIADYIKSFVSRERMRRLKDWLEIPYEDSVHYKWV